MRDNIKLPLLRRAGTDYSDSIGPQNSYLRVIMQLERISLEDEPANNL
jgi:hypothetical protein